LLSYEVIVNLIGPITTTTGLNVVCELDENNYDIGINVTDEELNSVSKWLCGGFEAQIFQVTLMIMISKLFIFATSPAINYIYCWCVVIYRSLLYFSIQLFLLQVI